jgi:hypothetical protein
MSDYSSPTSRLLSLLLLLDVIAPTNGALKCPNLGLGHLLAPLKSRVPL